MSSYDRIALITGANRGLGLECVRQLSEKEPGTLVLLGSRDKIAGEKALDQIKRKYNQPYNNVQVISIDVSSQSSVDACKQLIKDNYAGLDILVNNAAVLDGGAKKVMEVNYYGVKRVYHAFAPLLRKNARVVYVGSVLGQWQLSSLPSDIQNLLQSPALTEKQIDEEAAAYIDAVAAGEVKKRYGGDAPSFAYGHSKVLVHALLRVHARNNRVDGAIYSVVHPGYCATDMTDNKGTTSASDGAGYILVGVHLPQDHAGKLNGTFWSEGKQSPFLLDWPNDPFVDSFKPK